MTETRPSDAAHLPEQLGRRYLLEFDTGDMPSHRSDVLVIGSGIAGLTAALTTSRSQSVTLMTKGTLLETGTWYAQGGIAGAVGEGDSVDLHLADTIAVGAGLCDEDVVEAIVGEAPDALADLQAHGVLFDRSEDGVDLHLEGGHSLPRILHTGDSTGLAVQKALTAALRAAEGVELFERRFLVDLLTVGDRCVGAVVLDIETGTLETHWAGAVVLATGGSGQLYRVTTNPPMATGDGVAAAWRAGADIADLEFVQFHPTALDSGENPRSLITEALRGEGAYLLDCDGERFMPGLHPLAELAPRDVVTRALESVMKRCGTEYVWLDARHLGEEVLKTRFPTIVERVAEAGLDLSRDLVPVAPAAHYLIGGVRVDIDGRTSLPGLFASGEVTASGLHGANRLASNSLLEGLVFSRRICRAIGTDRLTQRETRLTSGPAPRTAVASLSRGKETLQGIMSGFVGTSRSDGSLSEAVSMLADMSRILDVSLRNPSELELQNLLTVGILLAHGAWFRQESRVTLSRVDHPDTDDRFAGHVTWRRGSDPRVLKTAGESIEWRVT